MTSLYFALCVALHIQTTQCTSEPPNPPHSFIQVAKTPLPEREEAPTENVKEHIATITAYTAVETCGDRCTMASGKQAYIGAAACPRSIPIGTNVQIDGVGTVTCEDRTALHTEGRVDIFFGYSQSDYELALRFGKQQRVVQYIQ